ncbi:hypothetical protein LYNGBM3L_18660 [Moorena producens 3L]|uniref:Uncharacterized protein n=1 Tax=Moorena producens 3L TaxID=489825 RepID=F4XM59_9CYAN|nr:hypothetical protein LYNGBM3L_18660 [Moorena producens 3L]
MMITFLIRFMVNLVYSIYPKISLGALDLGELNSPRVAPVVKDFIKLLNLIASNICFGSGNKGV